MKPVAQVVLSLVIFCVLGASAEERPCGSYPVDLDCLRDELVARSGCERREGPISSEIFLPQPAQCAFSTFDITSFRRDLTIQGFENTVVQDFVIWEDEGFTTLLIEFNNYSVTGSATGFFHVPNGIPSRVDFSFTESVDDILSLVVIPGTTELDLDRAESRPFVTAEWDISFGDTLTEAAGQNEQVGNVLNEITNNKLRYEKEHAHCYNHISTRIVFNDLICSYNGF